MFTKQFTTSVLVLTVIFMLAGGCCKCYKVTDTSTNKVYYTNDPKRTDCGTVEFHDLKTQDAWSFGEKITLQSAEVEEVPQCNCRFQSTEVTPCAESFSKTTPCPEKSPCSSK